MGRLRAGIVGTGWWAETEHLPGLQMRTDVEVTALCGRNQQRLNAVAGKFNVPDRFTDWRQMIAEGRLDLLVIVTPNVLHHPIAMAALSIGLHVICEKPLAMTAAQAREMAAAAEARKLQTLTFFTHRTIAAAAQLKRLIDEGFLGTPLHVSAVYWSASHFAANKPASWRMRRSEAGTGVLGDIGSHLVDMVRFWLGDFSRVSAQWQQRTFERPGGKVDADEDVSFLAQLKCGAQGVFQSSKLAAGRGNFQRIELYGDKGSLIYEAEPGIEPGWEGRLFAARADKAGVEQMLLPEALTKGLETPAGRFEVYRRLVDPFFEAIRNKGSSTPNFADGAAVQAVLDAVAASSEQGRWIDV
ncbi:MAG TPA: Gfo/Idh/MocA family oxidoreductase [Myxococcales bacterium]|nr:Gfo/Idh/MocA family oxidoreductase [Myxococcales bacterium]